MKCSKLSFSTLREAPAQAELASHQLMLRAGMIRAFASGIYTWLPLGLRILRKVETIVREEMNRVGAQELLMPIVQPAELWQKTGRWEQFGPELQRCKDRHGRDFCLGPTHEEVITELARRELRHHQQLPVNFYQIQSKFRDEIRPRFGVMRAREFMMKDAYSFHLDETCLKHTYQAMFDAYSRIFDHIGLRFRAVSADSGNIGGAISHEFHILAESGEDEIAFSDSSDYAANVEYAESIAPSDTPESSSDTPLQCHDTPGQRTISEVAHFLGTSTRQCTKTLIATGKDGELVALVLRGDHELNTSKAEKIDAIATPFCLADISRIENELNCPVGFLGPVGLKIPIIVDRSARTLVDFVCGANQEGKHLTGVNWCRDLPEPEVADLRRVVCGDPSPDGNGRLRLARGIEVGHIFQLGDKYSALMGATCSDDQGHAKPFLMGCYGIGISRVVAATIEQNHDARGIIWPQSIAPFQVILIPINMQKSIRLRQATMSFYKELQDAGVAVLLDDREKRPGVMFKDAELLGIPHRLVISERGIDAKEIEYCNRRNGEIQHLPQSSVLDFLRTQAVI